MKNSISKSVAKRETPIPPAIAATLPAQSAPVDTRDNSTSTKLEQAGFDIAEWCPAVGISVAKFYTLPATLLPRTARLGKRRLVIESPREYLVRIADQQQVAA